MQPTPFQQQKDDMIIVVMGATGSGKSTFINLLSGSTLAVGNGLNSCTSVVERSRTFQQNGRRITLIDTPGFDDTTRSDTEILTSIAAYLGAIYQTGWKLGGVLYMHRISDVRMTGTARKNFSMFRKLCGDEALPNVVIATNMWSEVSQERGIARERELASHDLFFKPVLEQHATMLRHDNTLPSAQAIIKHILDKDASVILKIQRELIDEHKDILQTEAGIELNRELLEQARKHQEELAQLRKDIKEAAVAKDNLTKKELEEARGKLTATMQKREHDRKRLRQEYAAEKRQVEQQIVALRKQLGVQEEGAHRRAQKPQVVTGNTFLSSLAKWITDGCQRWFLRRTPQRSSNKA